MLQRGTLAPSVLLRSGAAIMARPASASPPGRAEEERCFVAELTSADLVYFALSSDMAPPSKGAARPRCFVPPPGRCFSFSIPAAQSIRERIWAARLHREVRERLSAKPLGAGSEVLALLSYGPQGAAAATAPERGFLIQDARRLPETKRLLEELLRLWLPAQAHLCVYEEAEDGELWRESWSLKGAAEGKELRARTRVVAAERPELHPAVAHLLDSAVFRSLEAARKVLQESTALIPEAKAVLDLVERCPEHPKKGHFPVIVIEGLDATGKTTATQSLKDLLNAVLLRSPPSCFNQWRTIFDEEPTLVRRAFYAVTNYILASEIAQASVKSPVIVDRYWHSTAAYAIATEISGKVEDLPPLHHQVYEWPEDLLRPDMVLMLTVSPEERIRRLQRRGMEKTKEEAELEASSFFRQKVEESYRRMENPVCHPVDASPSKEEVLKTALHLIKKQCPLL